MKKVFVVFLLIFLAAVWIYKGVLTGTPAEGGKSFHTEETSVLPADLSSSGLVSKNSSSPEETAKKLSPQDGYPALKAYSAILFDLNKGRILHEKNAKEKCYPASTTKILTALIAIENCSLKDSVTVGDEANFPAPGSSMSGIRYGEKLTMEQLLNCLLIPSGNDAAYTIAAYTAGKMSKNGKLSDREAVEFFCKAMNKRARELGAKDSSFVNPDGFHDPEHYTTAYDLCLIARETIKHKEFGDIVRKTVYKLPDVRTKDKTGKQRSEPRVLVNTNKLLIKNDPDYFKFATGLKTGHTEEAGYCLVSTAETGNRDILAVVMGSTEEQVWSDSVKLLQLGLKK